MEGEEMEIIHDNTQEDVIIESHEERMKSFVENADAIGVEIYVKCENTKVKSLEGEEIKRIFNTGQLKYKRNANITKTK